MLPFPRARAPARCSALDLLPRCKTPGEAAQLHAQLVTTGLLRRDPSAATHLILRLCASPHPPLRLLARRIFFSSDNPYLLNPNPTDPFLYNALIKSSSHGSDPAQAILTFAVMLSDGVAADKFSFSLVLKACARLSSFREGVQIHSLLLKTKLSSELYLENSLIGFYSKCGHPDVAWIIFDRIQCRDSVSWNSMIDGYVKSGNMRAAQEIFDEMDEGTKNLTTWNSLINGYARSGDTVDVAREIFDRAPSHDAVSWNLMIDGYVKCGRLSEALDMFENMPENDVISWATLIAGFMNAGHVDTACMLFHEMPDRDVVTWNIMIDGHVKNGRFSEAILLFNEMQFRGDVAPDETTLACVLSAIAELGCAFYGRYVHDYIRRNCLPLDGKVGVALIDMYFKCGYLENALEVFEASARSVDHWNAMIGGLAIHGYGKFALKLFEQMKRYLIRPDAITFIGVLTACSHAGLVEEGLKYLEMMITYFSLEPMVQHYGCIIDILGRAGRLEEAWDFIQTMPMEPNEVVWRSLLSSCRNHGNINIGQKAMQKLVQGGCYDNSSCLLLTGIYAGCGCSEEVTTIRNMMRESDIRNIPGCSWIEVNGVLHEFVVGDVSHPLSKDIYSMLEQLLAPHYSHAAASS